jgi:hypothetical protein
MITRTPMYRSVRDFKSNSKLPNTLTCYKFILTCQICKSVLNKLGYFLCMLVSDFSLKIVNSSLLDMFARVSCTLLPLVALGLLLSEFHSNRTKF